LLLFFYSFGNSFVLEMMLKSAWKQLDSHILTWESNPTNLTDNLLQLPCLIKGAVPLIKGILSLQLWSFFRGTVPFSKEKFHWSPMWHDNEKEMVSWVTTTNPGNHKMRRVFNHRIKKGMGHKSRLHPLRDDSFHWTLHKNFDNVKLVPV
jgi:hypothetical protein